MIPSLPKLLGLIAIIWVVWTAFRIYETRQSVIRAQADRRNNVGGANDYEASERGSGERGSIDLHQCKVCGTFYSGENCGQENCRR